MAPRIGSLCTGYGGLDMAVQQVYGGTVAWHADIDPGASAILAHRYPTIPNLGDITAVDWDQVEPVDILTAGFPCQDVSLAGLRAGIAEGTRSGLWRQVARAIRELNPRLVVIENVRGLLSAKADSDMEPCTWCLGDAGGEPPLRALGAVLADLAGLGFDAEWASVRASEVGAAHQRERVFLLAWPADAQGAGRPGTGLRGRAAERGAAPADPDGVGGDGDRARRAGRHEPAAHRQPAAHANLDAVREQPVAEPGCGGPAVTGLPRPNTAPHASGVGEREPADEAHPVAGSRNARPVPGCGDGLAAADPESDGRHQGRPEPARLEGRPDVAVGGAPDWGPYGAAIARWERVVGRPAPRPTDPAGRLSPVFVEWLMGLPAGHVSAVPGLTRTAQLKALGNGVLPLQAEAAIRLLHERAALSAVADQAA